MHSANAPSTIKYNTGRPRNASVSVWINTIKTRNVSAKTNHTVDFQGTYLSDNLFVTDVAVYPDLSPGIFHPRGGVFVPTIKLPPCHASMVQFWCCVILTIFTYLRNPLYLGRRDILFPLLSKTEDIRLVYWGDSGPILVSIITNDMVLVATKYTIIKDTTRGTISTSSTNPSSILCNNLHQYICLFHDLGLHLVLPHPLHHHRC